MTNTTKLSRTLLAIPAVAALALAGLPIMGAAHASASGVITATEYSDVVVVDGSGLPAYDVVDVQFQAPDGEQFDAGEATANRAGQFQLTVPTYEFLQVGAGVWTVAAGDSHGQSTAFNLVID